MINTVAAQWIKLAIALEFDYNTIEAVKSNHSEAELSCIAILSRWMNGEGQQPATWETFIQALEDADYLNLAKDLKRELGSP